MTEARAMLSLAEDYLTERRALGFDLRIPGTQITAFARFVDAVGHTGPLTTRITLDWVQGHARHAKPFSWARRLDVLRPFTRYLARLDPATEFPQTAIFGRSHRRLAPHIYSEQEICVKAGSNFPRSAGAKIPTSRVRRSAVHVMGTSVLRRPAPAFGRRRRGNGCM